MEWWPGWHVWHGRWWMLQASFDGWFSLGIHIDPRFRRMAKTGERYAPYVDIHLACFVFSFGIRPYLSGERDLKHSVSRGGLPIDE